ncbi:cral trio domain protein [Cystoisospora suis]|uniref:Cral trio domain protein n=1 Tax=Cystoisospora suis TaxID=483139 RepID=A0A2C6KZV9_9APIC|nr:cral trio domain protein [Cystoisospora suis]
MYTAEAFLLQLLTWRSHGFINRLEARHVVHQELSNCWGCVYGLDRLSRPCLVIKLKNLKISFSSSSSSLDWVLALIYLVEEALKNMDRDVEQLTALIDAKDFSLSQIHIQELFMIKSLLQTYYPERLGLVLVISPNLQAKLLWRTLQSHLPESTRSKVFFVPETSPEKSRKFFLTFFEESRLPRWCIQRYFSPSPSSSSLVS